MQVQNHEIAVIGDRLCTDVLLANINNAVSVYVNPFDLKGEEAGIRLLRYFENILLNSVFGGTKS